MRILSLCHSFNSLSQRLYVELTRIGHEVSVEFDINDAVTLEAVALFKPDLIIAPFLKRAIPEALWSNYCCLVVHPGIVGDRGPSALDWAILDDEERWGVTVLQAAGEMDAGDIWASVEFPMRSSSKASLYRNELTAAAVKGVLLALERFTDDNFTPQPLDYNHVKVRGKLRPLMRQEDRRIDWNRDDTATVLRKIRSADGFPGILDNIAGRECYLFDACPEERLCGVAGSLIARQGTAICRATANGAIWIGHLRDKASQHPFKLPAAMVLDDATLNSIQEIPVDVETGYRELWYEEHASVGYLHFPFYNGAMSTRQCVLLRDALIEAKERDTRVIVLMGGPDFWSNGIHLNVIEAAESPADESWRNINAMNDLVREIIDTQTHLTLSAIRGNAGAGGVFLALAADWVIAREGVLLNPHYKDMGNLYGSEYWTYLLPRRTGRKRARKIVERRLPLGAVDAYQSGLIDQYLAGDVTCFDDKLRESAEIFANAPSFSSQLEEKEERLLTDEKTKPLKAYREDELAHMKLNFYGFDPSYHVARYNFVYKIPKSRTPVSIAHHRDKRRGNVSVMRRAS